MTYFHQDTQGHKIDLNVGKVVCVGRNYVDHVNELKNDMPIEPLLFMKPSTSLCDVQHPLVLPQNLGSCHNELELAFLLKSSLKNASEDKCKSAIWGVGLALDLTLRELQSSLKSKGLPWERAKSFDAACPMSGFVPIEQIPNFQSLTFNLQVNQQIKQQGDATLMIWDVCSLLSQISEVFTLLPGDIVITGTPKGVGPLNAGDELQLSLDNHFTVKTAVQR